MKNLLRHTRTTKLARIYTYTRMCMYIHWCTWWREFAEWRKQARVCVWGGSTQQAAVFWLLYAASAALSFMQVRTVFIEDASKRTLAIALAVACVALTIPISVYHTFQHLSHFVDSPLQAQIVRIVWMVPVYAVQSLLSLSYERYSFYFQALREFYESFVIYCFLRFLVYFLGEERNLERTLAVKSPHIGKHKPPFCCIPSWTMGTPFLSNCKAGVLQYVVIRFLSALTAFVLEYLGLYSEGLYAVHSSFFWLTLVDVCSQTWALYSLLLFYHATHKELMPIKPFGKFMCIKAVVFASWWQAIVIGVLVKQGYIGDLEDGEYSHSAADVADAIQELLICMEMFVASIAFYFAFPVSEFISTSGHTNPGGSTSADLSQQMLLLPANRLGSMANLKYKHAYGDIRQSRVACSGRHNSQHNGTRELFFPLLDAQWDTNSETKDKEAQDEPQGVSELVMLELRTGMGMNDDDGEALESTELMDMSPRPRAHLLSPENAPAPTQAGCEHVLFPRRLIRGRTGNFHHASRNIAFPPAQGPAAEAQEASSVLEALWTISVPVELEEDLRTLGNQVVDGWIKSGPRWLYRKWIRTRMHEHTGS